MATTLDGQEATAEQKERILGLMRAPDPAPWWDDACRDNMAQPDRTPRAHAFVMR